MTKIKTLILSILVILIATIGTKAEQQIKVEGVFQGENLSIQNPFAASGVGFCVYEIMVNGRIATDEICRSNIEVDLSIYGLKNGDLLKVVIKHKDGCTPKVLNAGALKPRSTFIASQMKVDKTGKVTWQTKDEKGALVFYIEQFKWKKWITVGQIMGRGTPNINNYFCNINLHSGMNKFRIKQVDYTKKPRYSEEFLFNNLQPAVTFTPGNNGKTSSNITFSRQTDYEIYDYFGKRLSKGTATTINVSAYPKGTYFINYDAKSEQFIKE